MDPSERQSIVNALFLLAIVGGLAVFLVAAFVEGPGEALRWGATYAIGLLVLDTWRRVRKLEGARD